VTYGGDSGSRIFVLYWRCSLIRVSVIRGSTVLIILNKSTCLRANNNRCPCAQSHSGAKLEQTFFCLSSHPDELFGVHTPSYAKKIGKFLPCSIAKLEKIKIFFSPIQLNWMSF
jgi:hypothetical protein